MGQKPNIFITRKLPESSISILRENYLVEMWPEESVPVPPEVLQHKVKEVDGLLCLLTENIHSEMLTEATNLKVISNMAVGYDNIDIHAAKMNNIKVTNTPGVLSETTADLTFALLMAVSRRLVEASESLKNGGWTTWSPMYLTGQDIYGSTLGILGLGRIGKALAKRARGFDMDVLYYSRSRKQSVEEELKIAYTDLETLLRKSDFVCIMTPYSPETKDLINEKNIKLMKKSSILINTARGGIVNENALYHALRNQDIWAAGLDVFENEPVNLDHPLLQLPNVLALPHIGSASINTRMKMAELAANNIHQILSGNHCKNIVNE